MTWLIAIDESGDLGKDSRFFTMAAMVSIRSRNLISVSKTIPKHTNDPKFYNSSDSEILTVLDSISQSKVELFYVTVDKHNYSGKYYGLYGNALYVAVLKELLDDVLIRLSKRDVRVMLDDCSFISASDFNKLVKTIATKNNCNIMNCEKKPSQQSKCIQIIDYIVGSIWRLYERSNPTYLDKLVDKVSVARKY